MVRVPFHRGPSQEAFLPITMPRALYESLPPGKVLSGDLNLISAFPSLETGSVDDDSAVFWTFSLGFIREGGADERHSGFFVLPHQPRIHATAPVPKP